MITSRTEHSKTICDNCDDENHFEQVKSLNRLMWDEAFRVVFMEEVTPNIVLPPGV